MNRRRALGVLALSAACGCCLAPGLSFAQDAQPAQSATVKDPVCKMNVDPAKAKGKSEYKGKTYYFCSESCKMKFDKEPAKYTGQ